VGIRLRLPRLVGLPQHPDQHRPQRPILLAVDQQFCEGATLRVGPELSESGRGRGVLPRSAPLSARGDDVDG
jgi:hypothetical protein